MLANNIPNKVVELSENVSAFCTLRDRLKVGVRAALVDCRLRPSSVPGAAVAMVHRLPKAASPQRKAAIIAADAVSHSESPPASPGVHSQPPYNYSYIL